MRAANQHASAIHLPAMQQGLTQVGPFVVMGHEVHPFWNACWAVARMQCMCDFYSKTYCHSKRSFGIGQQLDECAHSLQV